MTNYFNFSKILILVMLCGFFSAFSQENKVTGTVTDNKGVPVFGVTIMETGTQNGVTTDFDGNFEIQLLQKTSELSISYVGFKNQKVSVTGNSTIPITLTEDLAQLDEVVVLGYGTQRKRDLTGAVSAIKGAKLNIAPTPNLQQNLAGKLPGVITRQETGKPGSEGENGAFLIRGKSTFGNNNALVLVDGIERSIDRIDPNAIESITILKDAASAAIYGARAANGVVLVTTKRGVAGKPRISYNGSSGFQSSVNVPELLNAAEFSQYYNEARANSGEDPAFTPEQVQQYQSGALPSTDWWNTTIKKAALIQQHGLTVSGGSENVRYFMSLGLLDQDGLHELSSFKRYNVRSNVDINLSSRFKLGIDLAGRREDISDSSGGDKVFETLLNSQPTSPAFVPDRIEPGGLGYNGVNINPIGEAIRSGYLRTNNSVFQGNLTFDYDIPVTGLSARLRYAYDRTFKKTKEFKRPYTFYVVDLVNDIYNPFESISNITLNEGYEQTTQQTTQASLNYTREFNKHAISGLFLYEQVDTGIELLEAGRQGFVSSKIDQLFAGSPSGQLANGVAFETARQGYIGRLTYSYADKYLFQANVRHDGSFNFPRNKRWGTFPAFSVGWKISEEAFLTDVDMIEALKIRASWGQFGNDRVDPFQYIVAYKFQFGSVFGSSGGSTGAFNQGLQDNGLPNPDITWETATAKNIGLDFSLWDGHFSGEIDFFTKRTEDILIAQNASIPDTFGAELSDKNLGIVDNKGFEIALTYQGNIGDDFQFEISPNMTKATSEVVFIDEPSTVEDRNRKTGRPFDQTIGLISEGLFRSQQEIDGWADQDGNGNSSINTGDIKYKDINNDGKIDGFDETQIGKSTIPEIVYGLNLFAAYKGLELSASFQGATEFNSYAQIGAFGLGSNAIKDRVLDSYREGNEGATFPRIYSQTPQNNGEVSSFWLVDGTYLKLRNIQLGYNLPRAVLSKFNIEAIKFYISGNNLLTFSKYKFFDPERPFTESGNVLYYPQLKSFNVGININL